MDPAFQCLGHKWMQNLSRISTHTDVPTYTFPFLLNLSRYA